MSVNNLFNELIITEDGFLIEEGSGHASWNNTGNIILNLRAMIKSWSKRKDGFEGWERSIEEIIHFINKLFLIEFICMEIAKGDIKIILLKIINVIKLYGVAVLQE